MTKTFPIWRDGAVKQAISDFVARVCRKDSSEFVPPMERIAVFDNDGTLWAEQPYYFQGCFVLDRVRALAPYILSGKTNSRSKPPSRMT